MANKNVKQQSTLTEWLDNISKIEQADERIARTMEKLADVLSSTFTSGKLFIQQNNNLYPTTHVNIGQQTTSIGANATAIPNTLAYEEGFIASIRRLTDFINKAANSVHNATASLYADINAQIVNDNIAFSEKIISNNTAIATTKAEQVVVVGIASSVLAQLNIGSSKGSEKDDLSMGTILEVSGALGKKANGENQTLLDKMGITDWSHTPEGAWKTIFGKDYDNLLNTPMLSAEDQAAQQKLIKAHSKYRENIPFTDKGEIDWSKSSDWKRQSEISDIYRSLSTQAGKIWMAQHPKEVKSNKAFFTAVEKQRADDLTSYFNTTDGKLWISAHPNYVKKNTAWFRQHEDLLAYSNISLQSYNQLPKQTLRQSPNSMHGNLASNIGSKRITTINLKIESLVKEINIRTENIKESTAQITATIMDVLTKAVNDSKLLMYK